VVTRKLEELPQPKAKVDALAEHYGTHDAGSEMADGEWVEPPMVTTSRRLPKPFVDAL
jgi:hypothetical protein